MEVYRNTFLSSVHQRWNSSGKKPVEIDIASSYILVSKYLSSLKGTRVLREIAHSRSGSVKLHDEPGTLFV